MLDAAKQLHSIGFAIHWLRPKSKAPIEKNWSQSLRKPWAELKAAYKTGNNVGVLLGRASQIGEHYLCVIDCDVKSNDPSDLKEMRTKLAEILSTDAPCVLSGRGNGSAHYYVLTAKPVQPRRYSQSNKKVKVKMPSALKPSSFELANLSNKEIKSGWRLRPAWEISIMGQGQQVVLPPSIHPDTGKQYKWAKPFNVKALPVVEFENLKGSEPIERTKEEDYDFEEVDLLETNLDEEIIGLIINGKGCEDRSAALFIAARAMCAADLSDRAILSVLTDRSYFLGATGYDHAKSNSRRRAARWVNDFTLRKVRESTSADALFDEYAEVEELSDEEAEKQAADLKKERSWKLALDRNQEDGRPKSTFANVRLILEGTMRGEPFVAHNEFSVTDYWLVDCPWGARSGQAVKDVDTLAIKNWLVEKFRCEVSKDKIDEVVICLSNENKFHPVRDYLKSLEWDGRARVRDWLTTYLDAHEQSEEYLESLGPLILVGMVTRIFEPGAKFDWVPILEGKQGVGKSTTARILASDDYFNDTTLNLGDKDAVIALQGSWVVELGELSVMSRHDSNSLKEFVSRTTDKIRPPFGKRMLAFPRQCIFIGTTNRDQYLKDETGARRFMPIKVGEVEMEYLRKDREQLLAEAVEMYLNGYSIGEEGKKCEMLAAPENARRFEHDEIDADIQELFQRDGITINEKCFRVIQVMTELALKNDRQGQMRVATALKRLGYIKEEKMVGGVRGCWWRKKGTVPEE